jgi:hypothetical protein
LVQPVLIVDTITAVDPWIRDNGGALWQLQFGDLSLNAFVCEYDLLNCNNFIAVAIGVNKGSEKNVALNAP